MPRKGRGGERQGTPGTSYANRTDLNMPISTVPNQEYGMATAQRQAQQAIPMAASPSSAPQVAPQAARPPAPAPGSLPHIAPTQRPDEPVTTGLPFGPGAGPEAMGPSSPTLGQSIQSVANNPFASSLSIELANVARSLGM
jgi:hypothetical protein